MLKELYCMFKVSCMRCGRTDTALQEVFHADADYPEQVCQECLDLEASKCPTCGKSYYKCGD